MARRPRTKCPWAGVYKPDEHKYMKKMEEGIWIPKNPRTKREGYWILTYYCDICDAIITMHVPK